MGQCLLCEVPLTRTSFKNFRHFLREEVKEKGDIGAISTYFDAHPEDISRGGEDNTTALHYASMEGRLEVVEYLLVKGADITAVDKYGYNALHYASMGGHRSVKDRLLVRGAGYHRDSTKY